MLEQINPDTIENLAEARAAIRLLLNTVEEVLRANQALRDEIQELKDEVNRLKGEQGKPQIKPSKQQEAKDHSSEKERKVVKERRKGRKRDKVKIHQKRELKVDKSSLPRDAEFKGYEEVVVQDIIVTPNNTVFRKRNITRHQRARATWLRCRRVMKVNSVLGCER